MKRSCGFSKLILLFVLAVFSPVTLAQAERFELGQRLRACESAWDAQPDPARRKQAVPSLKKSVDLFFKLKLSEAGRALDEARFTLRSSPPMSAAELWAESLYLKPDSRFIDSALPALDFTIAQMYPAGESPKGARLRLTLLLNGKAAAKPFEMPIASIPVTNKLPLKKLNDGDYILRAEIVLGKQTLATTEQTLSVVSKLTSRMQALRQSVDKLSDTTTDAESFRSLVKLLASLVDKQSLETNYPAARLLAETEAAVTVIKTGKKFYGQKKTGQFWLNLAITEATAPVRLLAPATAAKGQPLPLVIAMHGAGGSENLFFDGYGRGAIAGLCEKRGWLLVAPRGSSGFTPVRAAEIIEAIDSLYPVDRKQVFVVGHSMGAAQAVTSAQATPERFAAVAALGGGGNVRKDAKIQSIPFFIGIGTEDFALTNARKLETALKSAEVKTFKMNEYTDIEHLVIVQVALPDVFKFFDQISAASGKERP
ncbi:MAG: alpha/beta fold hydrolase [Acidobacteriota bacterium]|nr:alpha/beta fold hydrolase [Acidobacteriota bacterium]